MLNAAQVRKDFEKLRSPNHEHGEVVSLQFGGRTVRAIRSTISAAVSIREYGEVVGQMFSLRFLVTDFVTPPKDKDIVVVDGVQYQVAEVRYSGFGQIVKIDILDEDA